jgi:hypothetical protein
MQRNRTNAPPFLRFSTPWQGFSWVVTLTITSSGYVTGVLVDATLRHGSEAPSVGSARAYVEPGDDVKLTIEACTVEASALATEPPLPGFPPRQAATLSRDEIHGLTASRPGGRR